MPHPSPRLFDSPCKGVCRIDERLGWCRGCLRTRAEIKDWPTASDIRKQRIRDQIAKRAIQEP